MDDTPIRVVHYLNQFFAGIGGEAAAVRAVRSATRRWAPPGPCNAALGDEATSSRPSWAATTTCTTSATAARSAVREALRALRPDVLVAGPAFEAGRYGLACAGSVESRRRRHRRGGRHAPEQPGRPDAPPRGGDRPHRARPPPTCGSALGPLVRLALKLARGEALGSAEGEGYLPRGIRKVGIRAEPGYRPRRRHASRQARGTSVGQRDPVPGPGNGGGRAADPGSAADLPALW